MKVGWSLSWLQTPSLCVETAPGDGNNENSVVQNMPGTSVRQTMEYSDRVFFNHLKHDIMKTKYLFNINMIEHEYYIMLFLSWTLWT